MFSYCHIFLYFNSKRKNAQNWEGARFNKLESNFLEAADSKASNVVLFENSHSIYLVLKKLERKVVLVMLSEEQNNIDFSQSGSPILSLLYFILCPVFLCQWDNPPQAYWTSCAWMLVIFAVYHCITVFFPNNSEVNSFYLRPTVISRDLLEFFALRGVKLWPSFFC